MYRKHARRCSLPQGGCSEIPAAARVLVGVLGNAQRALQDLFVDTGAQVVSALAQQAQERLCGPRGRHQPERQAPRWGRKDLELPLGGRKIVTPVGRVQSVGPGSRELALPSLEPYREEDPLSRRVLEQILCGVSTRRYARSLEPVPAGIEEPATSKSAVSRRLVALTAARMEAFLSRSLPDQDLLVLMWTG